MEGDEREGIVQSEGQVVFQGWCYQEEGRGLVETHQKDDKSRMDIY